MRQIILIFAVLLSFHAQASQCDIYGRINDAGLNDNTKFWQEFAELNAKGDVPEAQIASLMTKYKAPQVIASTAPAAVAVAVRAPRAALAGTQKITVHRTAAKAFEKTPPQVQNKVEDLITLFNNKGSGAIQDLKSHNWNYEYISQVGQHSVRLNQGYRAMITIDGGKMTIWNIAKDAYAH